MSLLAKRGGLRRFCVVALCLIIFLFAFQAKLTRYSHVADSKAHPTHFTKLGLDASSSKAPLPPVIVYWVAAALTYCLLLRGEPLEQGVFGSLVSHDVTLVYQSRFRRPPPFSRF